MGAKKFAFLLLLPCTAFVAAFLLIPLFATLLSTVFQAGSFTLDGYASTLSDPYFQQVFWRSLGLSLVATAVCVVLGFPVAYFVARLTRHRGLCIALALFPLMTSPVVRSFGWMVILGKRGMLNGALQAAGLIDQPLSLLYNEFSIVVGLVQLFLPMMIISTVGVMENIDQDLVLAAGSLGASRATTFWRVVFPLSVPGLITGSVLVFAGSITAYTTPQLLGGSETSMMATLIYQEALSSGDWVAASVVALVMIAVSVAVTQGINRLAQHVNPAI